MASNDGYLLREFVALGVPVLGIEPAANVAEIARAAGVRTLTAFFGRETARAVLAEHGHPRLIAANNVMAHVPDLDDFVGGLALLCDADTVITVENPSFVTLLRETQFDTIYHEHFSYLSAHAVARVVAEHGLELARRGSHDARRLLPLHDRQAGLAGGRRLCGEGDRARAERRSALAGAWRAFAGRSRATISGLRAWLDERAGLGARVAGYGAAAKGNTLLNAARRRGGRHRGRRGRQLGEAGQVPARHGHPRDRAGCARGHAPDDVLILPWNIAAEIGPIVAGWCRRATLGGRSRIAALEP